MTRWLFPPENVMGDLVKPGRSPQDAKRLSRLWLRSEQFLAAAPTIILAGMYGAATFSLLALGPAWIGFLVAAAPVLGIALWAFAGPNQELSG